MPLRLEAVLLLARVLLAPEQSPATIGVWRAALSQNLFCKSFRKEGVPL